MPFVVLDKDKNVVAIATSNHVEAPSGGTIVELDEKAAALILATMAEPVASVARAKPTVDIKQIRRNKMWAISDSSVESRGRVFKEFPHVHMMDQHRHIDLMVMFMRGKLVNEDKILTRNLKSGEYEQVTVGSLLDQIEKTFYLRQVLRKHDQEYRDKINSIYRDPNKTDEQKAAEMEAVEVPPRLGVSAESKVGNLVIEKK